MMLELLRRVTLLKELTTTDPQPFDMHYDAIHLEQIRKHKKKRINKKWAKRYGYREVLYKIIAKDCYIRHNPLGDFDIIIGSEIVKKEN